MNQIAANSSRYVVQAADLSTAWAGAFLALAQTGCQQLVPLVVNITGQNGVIAEIPEVREALDARLASSDKLHSTATTSNLIFPEQLWRRHQASGRQEFFRRYREVVYPRLRRAHRQNAKGIYFQRMISYGPNGVDQLSHIIDTWLGGNHRRSAQQIVIFDPTVDHTNSPYMGFPCLDYVAFAADGQGGLSMSALYANHYVFDRAYGNYLGLWHLGSFVAGQIGLEMRQLTCISGVAQLGSIDARDARSLAKSVAAALTSYETGQHLNGRVES